VAKLDEKDLEQTLFDRYAMLHKQRHGHYPLLVETECYTYMGQGVKIVSCNVFDTIKNAEIVIESRGSNVATVDFQELSWKFSRVTIDAMAEVSQDEYIANGARSKECSQAEEGCFKCMNANQLGCTCDSGDSNVAGACPKCRDANILGCACSGN
jgi:hypothetical protein